MLMEAIIVDNLPKLPNDASQKGSLPPRVTACILVGGMNEVYQPTDDNRYSGEATRTLTNNLVK